jgi:hypothetical protein
MLSVGVQSQYMSHKQFVQGHLQQVEYEGRFVPQVIHNWIAHHSDLGSVDQGVEEVCPERFLVVLLRFAEMSCDGCDAHPSGCKRGVFSTCSTLCCSLFNEFR